MPILGRWLPTLASLPGESCGQRNVASYSPWGYKEWQATVHGVTKSWTQLSGCQWSNSFWQFDLWFDYVQASDCVDHKKLWKILKEMGIPDHLTCLLRNLYAGQEATVWTGLGTTDWFQIGKGIPQGCILSPCLFNLYAEYEYHEKCWAGWGTSWNQDCWEKYQ